MNLRCLVAIALLTCTPAAAEAGLAEAQQEFQARAIGCNNKFPPGNPIIAIKRGECLNAALRIILPYVQNPDLLQYFMAQRAAIVERFAKGKLTQAETNAEIARVASQVVGEEERRKIARASLVAQQRATAAAEHAAAAQARAAAAQDDISTAAEIGTVFQIMRGFSR